MTSRIILIKNALKICVISLAFLSSCILQKNEVQLTQIKTEKTNQIQNEKKDDGFKLISKYLRFAASVDREILKVIRPQISLAMTQLEVLSTIFDQYQGIKRNFGLVDCKLYQIEKNPQKQLSIYKQCQNPKVLIALIDYQIQNKMKITFLTKEWSSQVGASVAFTAVNRICDLKMDQDKLIRMSCENTSLAVDQAAAEIQELKLDEYVFDQKAKDQVHVLGGFYKNLILHRKLELSIPFDGKIKIIEKELKVQDDFIETEPPKINNEDKNENKNENKNNPDVHL